MANFNVSIIRKRIFYMFVLSRKFAWMVIFANSLLLFGLMGISTQPPKAFAGMLMYGTSSKSMFIVELGRRWSGAVI
ncbi:MAG: hypothetical protein RMJ32_03525 [Aquificaceae bacterium]|nr:hypothetical protein [Aquificaceae bacterium]